MTGKLTRRQFLVPLGVMTLGSGGVALRILWNRGAEELDFNTLGMRLGDLTQLGSTYLESFPSESTVRVLAGRLSERFSLWPENTLTEQARLAVGRDFEEAETFNAHGWILSRTEGRLAALTVLL